MPSAPPRDRPGVGTSGRLWGDFPGLMLGRWLESTTALWGTLGLATGGVGCHGLPSPAEPMSYMGGRQVVGGAGRSAEISRGG